MKNLVWAKPLAVSALRSTTPFASFNVEWMNYTNFYLTIPDSSLFAHRSKGSLSSACLLTGRFSAFASLPTYA